MTNDEMEKQRFRVAAELGVDSRAMRDHPYDLEMGKSGSLLIRWHDQAPDGVIREGRLGSYTTFIPSANASAPLGFSEEVLRRSQSG